jgi:hypothetical protein
LIYTRFFIWKIGTRGPLSSRGSSQGHYFGIFFQSY